MLHTRANFLPAEARTAGSKTSQSLLLWQICQLRNDASIATYKLIGLQHSISSGALCDLVFINCRQWKLPRK